ncbi:NAD(P)H-quinone oxidoreductase chain 5 [uncultured Synechococcales cyanobacterium]|uniref:NAD(P)H-quinone oxidoreductase chain 5 n=1 Tax=uncultured Synechococcales cyanobacterium TaxID=1936017 RepID=A0A6J4VUB8_9CYAN|nr:NAD(P)H-quinone oxidoreductase chain 5 [uncultured Synechococcales cyanobacterium]
MNGRVLNKPRDVQVLPIATGTMVVRSRSWTRLKFEIEYALQRGTTANTYLIQGAKTALIDPPGETFTEIFLQELQQRLDFQRLDYVVLGHVNPNRVATLKALLSLTGLSNITVVCSNPGAIALRNAWSGTADSDGPADQPLPKIQIMRGESTLDLGQGHQLQFIPTPSPRWPDSLCTYDPQTEILFSDKLFGAHVCGDQVFDEGWQALIEDRRYYYDCLMAPNARSVETALEKLTDLPVRLYAPGHGPIVRYGLIDLTRSYEKWNREQKIQETSVALLYASAYGNTATLGQAIARGITKAGVAVEAINCEVAAPEEIREAAEKCAGFIIGSPTLGGHMPTPVQTALGIVLATASKSKLAGVFGSYGWSGEAIDLIETKLQDAGYSFGFEPIRIKFKPTDATLQFCEEAGTDFAQSLKKAKKVREPRQSQPASSVEQAVGRIVGSLSVITAQRGDAKSAMLASWVSQATFTPPGLTIAVAKDRAIESLMHSGGRFALNVLAEGKHLGLMKHFLKPFGPGEDRFAGVETQEASNGSPILKDALAYLECRAESRMECGDHWLVYAVVENGSLLQPNALTAIHHRKSGTRY